MCDAQPAGEGTPAIRPLRFEPGCNTTKDVRAQQIRTNAARNVPWLTVRPEKNRPLVIVAGGPSLKYRWPEITSHDGAIMALNNTYGFLRDRGIDPDYYVQLDAREANIDFVRDPCRHTEHLLSAQCHPSVYDALADHRVTLWFSHEDTAISLPGEKIMLSAPAGTVGMKALSMAYALGYREWHLYGYDSSYADTHHAYPQPLNDENTRIEVFIEPEGRAYVTTPTLSNQAAEFVPFARNLTQIGCDINLHCDGLLPDLVVYANTRGEIPLIERERAKYQEIWSRERYGDFAPGEHFVDTAIEALGIQSGDSVIDYGCGSGKGAMLMADRGTDVIGVDFADNCPSASEKRLQFVHACLWELPDTLGASDWAYCTDVMEHIPQEKVLEVLQGIAERTRKGAFFNIATRDDVMGGMIGKKLHMSVMPADTWHALLSRYWSVSMAERDGEASFICKPR